MKHPDAVASALRWLPRWRYCGSVLSVAGLQSWKSRSLLRFATVTRLQRLSWMS